MEDLISRQLNDVDLLSRAFINLKKKGGQSSKGVIESHLAGLEKKWNIIEDRHESILRLKTDRTGDIHYFKSDFIGEATNTFYDERGKFLDALHALESSTVPRASGSNTSEPKRQRRKLAPIEITPFAGKYSEWTSFRDYFTTLVADDPDLQNVEKLHYLRASLKGEAANLIKNIPITADSYERAWKTLISYYDNKRNLLKQCLDAFLQIQPITIESPQGLKRLRDGAIETVETLQVLGRPASAVDDFLVHLTIQRCDPVTRRDWELSLGDSTELLTWSQVDSFLKSRIQALERAEPTETTTPEAPHSARAATSGDKKASSHPRKVTVHTASSSKPASRVCCSYCQASHFVAACDKFRARPVDDRSNFVSEKQLCYNCLGPHRLAECRSKKSCFICQGRHHTLIHRAQPSQQSTAAAQSSSQSPTERPPRTVASHATNTGAAQSRAILLATARLTLSSDNDRSAVVRALIDPCSEASFITERLAQRLRLPRQSVAVSISGVGAALCHTARSATYATISPRFESSRSWRIRMLILPRLTNYMPPPQRVESSLTFTEGVRLADPHLESLDSIEMILGADVFPHIIEEGLLKSPDQDTLAQATGLGWILTGAPRSSSTRGTTPQSSPPINCLQCLVDGDLPPLLERFWAQEEATDPSAVPLTSEEVECETHFSATQRRTSEGKYVLKLPFKSNLLLLGNSEPAARAMLQRMERSFVDQPQLREKYVQFMKEYETAGHMREVLVGDENPASTPRAFYLPHHGVFKTHGDTSKLRVVFNGSVKLRSGLAINDCLHTGPKLQSDIFNILLRWRIYRYVFSADIKQMFRQILVDPDDQRYQRILWRDSTHGPIRTYQLCTVTYGLASSPYQAIRTLRQLASDEGHRLPQAAELLRNNSYVDDILAGADTLDEANHLKAELVELLMAGGFPLSKWTANHPSILSNVPDDQLAASQHRIWQQSEALTMLGISWQPSNDAFHFCFSAPPAPEVVTKRKALSLIAQLYDPLGWIVPITVRFKIFMQTLWHTGLDWDDSLPPPLQVQWNHYFEQLQHIRDFSIPRWVGISTDHRRLELHGFSDASERAYAACLYVRTTDDQGNVNSMLLASKSKVAPLKQVSLPRLELSGALLLVRLTKRIQDVLGLEDVACHLWSDSTVTLSWIREHPSVWKTYVANRVSEIQTTLPQASWHHVAGKENPADCASRGVSPRELADSPLWLSGPSFLRSVDAVWTSSTDYPSTRDCPERRGPSCLVVSSQPSESETLLRFSCLTRLLRVTTRCLEFIQRLRSGPKQLTGAAAASINHLDPVKLESTLKFWVKHTQNSFFHNEIRLLSQARTVSLKSPLIRLNPFVDDLGLLRVGGRLRHSLLHPDERHPIILPRESHLALLVVRNAHAKTLHGGTQLTLSYVRQRFWIVRGRQLVKTVILKCLRCWRQRAGPTTQLMGDLPSRRVQRYRPFLHSGIDYAGPINLRLSKGRGTRSYKGYIAVFVCLATRAVHLEVASGYSTADFLNVYRRFAARRGICASLSSDCGTTFVGADTELRNLFAQAGAQSAEIAQLLANDGTEWKFNPPAAPHFGGIWEAAVKSTKLHLRRVLGETILTFEEMTTLLAQIEACLNSRPLYPLSDDITDASALTPAHFLIGEPTLTVPEPSALDSSLSRPHRWQLLRQMYEHFWNRWSSEYLHELQHRPKWRTQQPQPKVGDLCLVRASPHPPCKWPLARVIAVTPGADGLVRVVELRTATTTLTRPVAKISLLPRHQDGSPESGEGGRNVPESRALSPPRVNPRDPDASAGRTDSNSRAGPSPRDNRESV